MNGPAGVQACERDTHSERERETDRQRERERERETETETERGTDTDTDTHTHTGKRRVKEKGTQLSHKSRVTLPRFRAFQCEHAEERKPPPTEPP